MIYTHGNEHVRLISLNGYEAICESLTTKTRITCPVFDLSYLE